MMTVILTIQAGQVVLIFNHLLVKKFKQSQFLLALFCIVSLSSCNTSVSVSENTQDDQYTYILYNPTHNVKFHSLGGRKLKKRLIYKKYGKLVFTNQNYLGGNKLNTSLFIINKIPENITKKETVKIDIYNDQIKCYEITNSNKNLNLRYFTYKGINYLFVTEFKKVPDKKAYGIDWYSTQEMNGLEL